MSSTPIWSRAALVPVARDGRRSVELVALPAGLPTPEQLFTFMRDAEARFQTLRMRLEERTYVGTGEHLVVIDVAVRHPGNARVTTTEPDLGVAGNYEVWVSDGEIVRTYAARHRLGTQRPVRPLVRGLDDPDLPGPSRVYVPVTDLPTETLPDTFVHPAGYCQNVLATGRCWVSGTDIAAGREAVVLECDHPRTVERAADRPDYHVRVAVDRLEGIITRLTETIGGEITRDAEVTVLEADRPLPPDTFEFAFPTGTTILY
jgi:hypothetical protein